VYGAVILKPDVLLESGLLRSVHPDTETLLFEAKALAHRIIDGRSSMAIALSRMMIKRNATLPHPIEAHRIDSLAVFYSSIADGKEGVAAFLEKRAAKFTSKASDLWATPGLADLFTRTG
jgi:enoyl-CoA hydratase/carnithine racemase